MFIPRTLPSITALVVSIFTAMLLLGCGEAPPLWREQKLPSGKQVKVTSMLLARGAEHDERFLDKDCFTLAFVTTQAEADSQTREREAREVFELIRPISEQWGFKSATLTAFRTPKPEVGRR
jgi:hypothetical protein